MTGIVALLENSGSISQNIYCEEFHCGRLRFRCLAKALVHVVRRLNQLVSASLPQANQLHEQMNEPRPAMAIFRREVGSAEKWFKVWGKKYTHGPASLARSGLHEG